MVFIAYSFTLSIANAAPLWDALAPAAANTVPTTLFGAVAYWIIVTHIVGRPTAFQAGAHLVLAAGFALVSYWFLLVLLGVAQSASAIEFEVRPLISRAMAWQTLQNVTVYGIVAVLAHHRTGQIGEEQETDDLRESLARYFIRIGDDAIPIDTNSIVSITGAGDYAEVATASGRHLVHMTLAKFESLLPPASFVRIHRSNIVNLDHIARLEPAGSGRLLVHMDDGATLSASRAGSSVLRERIL
ncbi:LytTR family DNA-binding domain-containing protein [Qipengyuania sp. R86523]|uniref:LytTR family DNA-binding domain-containing protein n=1 Tax=Qipengyuania sp. R86523 TaxID=3093862 RepID=UPI0037C87966